MGAGAVKLRKVRGEIPEMLRSSEAQGSVRMVKGSTLVIGQQQTTHPVRIGISARSRVTRGHVPFTCGAWHKLGQRNYFSSSFVAHTVRLPLLIIYLDGKPAFPWSKDVTLAHKCNDRLVLCQSRVVTHKAGVVYWARSGNSDLGLATACDLRYILRLSCVSYSWFNIHTL